MRRHGLGLVLGCALACALAGGSTPVFASAMGLETGSNRGGLDRSIRKINLSAYVTRTQGLAPICSAPKRVLSMNVRYADLDGDSAEDVVFEAVTCKSRDGLPDVAGVFAYQHPDSLRALPIEDSEKARSALQDPRAGPPRLELSDGRLIRWVLIDKARCLTGGVPLRRVVTYRWAGSAFVVDRIDEHKAPSAC